MRSAEETLAALGTDYLDILLLHRPDPLLQTDEVLDAFSRLYKDGKVRFFGVSNFSPEQFSFLQSRLSLQLVTNQIEFSLMHINPIHDGTLEQCQRHNISPMAWSPLGGGGLLSIMDSTNPGLTELLTGIATKYNGATPAAVALAWLLRHPAKIVPIVGTINRKRLEEAAIALSLQLDREDWFLLYSAAGGAVC
jgi:predicted oxidoreductase